MLLCKAGAATLCNSAAPRKEQQSRHVAAIQICVVVGLVMEIVAEVADYSSEIRTSYVLTVSKLTTWRMMWYSSWMPDETRRDVREWARRAEVCCALIV